MNGDLVWEFTNLEPTEEQNIEVAFSPAVLNIWQNRPSIVASMSASTGQEKIYQSSDVRLQSQYPGWFIPYNVINVINYQEVDYGWLIEQ